MTISVMNFEQLQKNHYNTISPIYTAHYGDVWSQEYRQKFINEPMLAGVDLAGMKVVEAMCGSGETTNYLLQQGAHVTGIDISEQAIQAFQQCWPQCQCRCTSILQTGLKSDAYDCVVVVGGLHHIHPQVSAAIHEIHRILKPGGYFCFAEPHQGAWPDIIRRYWYRHDRFFVENEAALAFDVLKEEFLSKFVFHREVYKGNIAYLTVLNSLILRIPLKLKRFYAPFFLWLEGVMEPVLGGRLLCIVVSRWQKR